MRHERRPDMQPEGTTMTVNGHERPAARVADEASETPWTAAGDRVRHLRHVAAVTHAVAELDPVVHAWTHWLGYTVVAQGRVPEDLAALWNAPGAAGLRQALLAPASGDPSYIRFIECGGDTDPDPPITCGWNATELLVTDVDALARRLADSPFRILGGPADLYPREKAPRAMQTRGPAGELVYFTRLLPGGSRYGLKQARSAVDRVFIVTVGGRSGDAMEAFYGGAMGLRVMDRVPFINPILAHGCRVHPGSVFQTSIAPIPGRRFLVEMDEYPAAAGAAVPERPRSAGGLPGGMAMVTFFVPDLDRIGLPFRAPPRRVAGLPYCNRRAAVIEGAAGEWLELVEGETP